MKEPVNILVIDDDPLLRSLVVSLLREKHSISAVGDGSEGFSKALELPPDVLILDIQMPGWDGFRTLRAFRSHPSLAHVKIMMLTSDASKDVVLAAMDAGADAYVVKTTFSKEEFHRQLALLIDESVPLPTSGSGERTMHDVPMTTSDKLAKEPAEVFEADLVPTALG